MTVFGIHTARHHLDPLPAPVTDPNAFNWNRFYRWAGDNHWNNGKPPTFAGRYFLGGMFQWGHGEGSAANEIIKTQWIEPLADPGVAPIERIVPIQAADLDRQSGVGLDGLSAGLADGRAFARRVAACIAAKEFSGETFIHLYLDVAKGTALSPSYWAGWAHAVYSFPLDPRAAMLFVPSICCEFVERVEGEPKPYSLDTEVSECLNTAQLQHPQFYALCWSFWAKASSRANLAQPLDFGRFPEYQQPKTTTGTWPVRVHLWRYAEQAAKIDPNFVGGNGISLDAVNDRVGDFVVNRMLRIEEWSAAELGNEREGGVALAQPPLYMGVDRATPFTQDEAQCLSNLSHPDSDPVSATREPDGVNITFSGHLRFVMRYYAPPPTGRFDKRLTADEVRVLVGAGLRVAMFWQIDGKREWEKSKAVVRDNAVTAFKAAAELNQPPHTPIYFVPHDEDSEETNVPRLAQRYFLAVQAGYQQYLKERRAAGLEARPYSIGVWGGNLLFDYLYTQGIVSHFFQGCSWAWNHNRNARVWAHINGIQVRCRLLTCDFEVDVNASWGDEGADEAWELAP